MYSYIIHHKQVVINS